MGINFPNISLQDKYEQDAEFLLIKEPVTDELGLLIVNTIEFKIKIKI